MGAAQAPVRGRGAPVPPDDERAGQPSRDGEEQLETVACFALPAFCFGRTGRTGLSVRAATQTLGARLILGWDPGEYPGPAGFGILRHSPGVPNPEP